MAYDIAFNLIVGILSVIFTALLPNYLNIQVT